MQRFKNSGIKFQKSCAKTPLIACMMPKFTLFTKIVSEYDQEIPQTQTADNPVSCKKQTNLSNPLAVQNDWNKTVRGIVLAKDTLIA